MPLLAGIAQDANQPNSPPTNEIVVDGVNTKLELALESANRRGNTTVVVTSDQALVNGVVVTGSHVRLTCRDNVTLRAGAGGFALIRITGSDDAFSGCHVEPGQFVASASAVGVIGATRPIIQATTISGFEKGLALIYLSKTDSPVIKNNHLATGEHGPDGIFGERGTTDADIEGNVVDESLGAPAAHAIALHSTEPGKSVSDAKIVDNTILGGLNFCVEVGSFGGERLSGAIIDHNVCKLSKDGGSGGYSLSEADHSKVTNNAFSADGFTYTIGGFEAVLVNDSVLADNLCSGSSPGRVACIVSSQGLERVAISHNTIEGFGSETYGAGIYVGTSRTSRRVIGNTIEGNVIRFPAHGTGRGIWIQCNALQSDCSDNVVQDNEIDSGEGESSTGILIENDSGTLLNTVVAGNTIRGAAVGIHLFGDVFKTQLGKGTNAARTPLRTDGQHTRGPIN